MENRNIVILLRVPFLDKIPSLKTLIIYLSKQGYYITIVSSYSELYPQFDSQLDNVDICLVKQRNKIVEVPTSMKLLLKSIFIWCKKRPKFFIGGDCLANILLFRLSRLLPIKYINFLLEYPDISSSKETKSLEAASYIITHDQWHRSFLQKHYKIGLNKFLFLPNASYTPMCYEKDNYLYRELNIPMNKKIILHSGGLGKWFLCKELARSTDSWPENFVLVFHTSHMVNTSSYYKDMINNISEKVRFSIQPVSNEVLDKLVASAYIGIALYSVPELGYRALYMGLAAGKIGNYLKCGIPVIASDLPSLDYIKNYKCGVLVTDVSQVGKAILIIQENYELYSKNARKCYQELWNPDRYLAEIEKNIFRS